MDVLLNPLRIPFRDARRKAIARRCFPAMGDPRRTGAWMAKKALDRHSDESRRRWTAVAMAATPSRQKAVRRYRSRGANNC
jgi:hypothetical protein